MAIVFDGRFQVLKVAGMGAYNNNGYLVVDPKTRETYLVDAPDNVERMLAEAKGLDLKGVVITHTHPDHVAGYDTLKRLTGLPVAIHQADQERVAWSPDITLTHQSVLSIGTNKIRIMHTPGHTSGGLCLVLDGVLLSGDTLFPGGPGRTDSPVAFRQLVDSITTHLLVLPPETLVLPGHGDDTTIETSQAEYATFASKPHPEDLHHHVSWLTS